MYEEFLGYRKQPRHYLGHAILETMWLPGGEGRKSLIEMGITLDDGTFVKGFPSYPADATIVKLTLENLPFLPALKLPFNKGVFSLIAGYNKPTSRKLLWMIMSLMALITNSICAVSVAHVKWV
ncbi:hypothetical protein MAM1_0085c04718 [Mucor ambiguus]|uniref:Uncharacterized protein n=1 Tax=Mucor ambiguus TaxID=91626 RepID=A0A0C9MD50_9FUNG|nr:hypothetical protein MAM1_0085c04718 [Mucor ambiguus]